MKRKLATIYAVFCTLLLVAGFLLVFYFSWQGGTRDIVGSIVGFIAGFVLAPVIHESGHVSFALGANMDCVYFKAFCFKIQIKNGKRRFSLASLFAADETQVIPRSGGDMQKRAVTYTLGGLIFSGIFLFAILSGAIVTTLFRVTRFELWGILPYVTYLFILNLAPLEYASGKTDTLVYNGIKKGCDEERNLLAAMEIQGSLYAGKTFGEIDEKYYFDVPQLCEDEPLFAVMLDLRYRYYLEKNDFERAADCLNRLVLSQEYLSPREAEKIAAELTYMHAINGDLERAEESGKLCREYLKEDNATAKRILLAYSIACGKTEAIEPLKEQFAEALKRERIVGIAKFEEILVFRLETGMETDGAAHNGRK